MFNLTIIVYGGYGIKEPQKIDLPILLEQGLMTLLLKMVDGPHYKILVE